MRITWFFFSSRRRHTRYWRDWSSDVCSSDLCLGREGYKLLLVGYQSETAYAQRIKALSGKDGIVVADAVYDAEILAVLRTGCFCYVHGNSVGGTNPALLEEIGRASCRERV